MKFVGSSKQRVPISCEILEEVHRSGCDWAVCYPKNKRPRQVSEGDWIFFASPVGPHNHMRIFGRAIATAYREGRDDATRAEIRRMPWKKQWPRYIRVHDAEFVQGTMENAVSLDELMGCLNHDSFMSTQLNKTKGEGNPDPKKAYRSQPAVELTRAGFVWLNERLERAFGRHGKVLNSG